VVFFVGFFMVNAIAHPTSPEIIAGKNNLLFKPTVLSLYNHVYYSDKWHMIFLEKEGYTCPFDTNVIYLGEL
jgi:hypothetical protein